MRKLAIWESLMPHPTECLLEGVNQEGVVQKWACNVGTSTSAGRSLRPHGAFLVMPVGSGLPTSSA
jgi:hypothetical protein